jgi:hypothetical protein
MSEAPGRWAPPAQGLARRPSRSGGATPARRHGDGSTGQALPPGRRPGGPGGRRRRGGRSAGVAVGGLRGEPAGRVPRPRSRGAGGRGLGPGGVGGRAGLARPGVPGLTPPGVRGAPLPPDQVGRVRASSPPAGVLHERQVRNPLPADESVPETRNATAVEVTEANWKGKNPAELRVSSAKTDGRAGLASWREHERHHLARSVVGAGIMSHCVTPVYVSLG